MPEHSPETARSTSTPPGVRLCPIDEIPDGRARNFVLQMRTGRFHGFAIRRGTHVTGYVDRCPHAGVPLAHRLDDYLTPDGQLIACHWHGALFEIDNGRCVGGPCSGQSLIAWPVIIRDGWIETA
ncbi:MAG TPA: Rieske (2Fe-2S) protein [Sphingobium sp.]